MLCQLAAYASQRGHRGSLTTQLASTSKADKNIIPGRPPFSSAETGAPFRMRKPPQPSDQSLGNLNPPPSSRGRFKPTDSPLGFLEAL